MLVVVRVRRQPRATAMRCLARVNLLAAALNTFEAVGFGPDGRLRRPVSAVLAVLIDIATFGTVVLVCAVLGALSLGIGEERFEGRDRGA